MDIVRTNLAGKQLFLSSKVLSLGALLGVNWSILALTLISSFTWWEWGSIWLLLAVVFTQILLLAFWGAFRGGSLVVRLGIPFLAVIIGSLLALQAVNWTVKRSSDEFGILSIPLGIAWLTGLGLILPARWWLGKSLLFPGESPLAGKPRQLRIHHLAGWTLLAALVLGLARASGISTLVTADLAIVLLVPCLLAYLAFLSIPMVRGVFATKRPLFWSVGALLLVIGIGIFFGAIACGWMWQRFGRGMWWQEYLRTFLIPVFFHVASALLLLGNLAAIRALGGRFQVWQGPSAIQNAIDSSASKE